MLLYYPKRIYGCRRVPAHLYLQHIFINWPSCWAGVVEGTGIEGEITFLAIGSLAFVLCHYLNNDLIIYHIIPFLSIY